MKAEKSLASVLTVRNGEIVPRIPPHLIHEAKDRTSYRNYRALCIRNNVEPLSLETYWQMMKACGEDK